MPPLSSDQTFALGTQFQDLATAVGDYRISRWASLSEQQRNQIESIQWTLMNYSSDFLTQSVQLALDDAGPALAGIRQATSKLKDAITTVKVVADVISAAGKAVAIGAAIASGHPDAIAKAVAAAL